MELTDLSKERLKGVNANLVKVIELATTLTKQPFQVTQGLRTKVECYVNYGKGRSASECASKGVPTKYAQPTLSKVTWLSNPLASKHATGKAVDLVPYPVDWKDLSKFKAIADAILEASRKLGVTVTWGGSWKTSKDYPHFEIK